MPRPRLAALLTGLLLSGVASILNQVVWQRALKLYLGGSESLSAMTVVVVFLGGLGLGSALAGRWSTGLRRPLLALAAVECALALLNLGVAGLLGQDLRESVYGAWRLALSVGLPLRLVYGLGAALILLPPTLLMGATVPLAAAGCQRQLGAHTGALVSALLVLNTVGAALGAWLSTAVLLPHWGQRAALLVAVAGNLGAALLAGLSDPGSPATALEARPAQGRRPLRREEALGAALGLLSLSYEMLLLRALTLCFEPLPVTFAVALSAYLGTWTVGVALSGRLRVPVPPVAALTGLSVALLPGAFLFIRDSGGYGLTPVALLFSLPCLGFGALYGGLARSLSEDWGRDLGRYGAANTLGSCLGVLGFTLVGFEAPLASGAVALAVGVLAVAAGAWRPRLALPGALLSVAVLGHGLTIDHTEHAGELAWWGRDGVVELGEDGQVYLDGLWHTRLSDGADHIGEPYAWLMAAGAVLGRGEAPLRRALVVGGGVGISSVTLAGVEGLQVDTYEINHTLQRLHAARPAGTLRSLTDPAIAWMWMDARAGLALNEQRYDLILSAPLHLRAAGSSLLLSLEYLDLIEARLEPGGVVVVYANEGIAAQALLVQRTLAERFDYRVTWNDGMVTVASDRPLTLTPEGLAARMAKGDRFAAELRTFDAALQEEGSTEGLWGLYEGDARTRVVADRPITDDHPLLEYPERAVEVVRPVRWAEVQRGEAD
jgi:spermidine synthase